VLGKGARLLLHAGRRFFDHNGPDRAAAMAFYTLLSLLPLLIFVISVGVAMVGSFEVAYRGTLTLLRGVVLPLDDAARESLRAFVARAAALRWPGILLFAWTSRRVFGALLSALETVFAAESRGFARGNLTAFALVLLSGIALLVTLLATAVFATLEGFAERVAGPGGVGLLRDVLGTFSTRLVPIGVALLFFYLIYRFLPRSSASVLPSHALAGALIATGLWQVAQVGFAYYVRNLAQYSGLYGALEGVIVLALWLELSASIVLFGAEAVAVMTLDARQKPTEVLAPILEETTS
jgi:membrane protein